MKVRLECWSGEGHLAQVYAGLTMLSRQGRIALVQQIVARPPPNRDPACPKHLVHVKGWHCAIEADRCRFYVDVHDDDHVDPQGLDSCDVYLKRSYNPRKPLSAKVRPLGLNYRVHADGFDILEFERRRKLSGWSAAARYTLRHPLGVSAFEALPADGEPRVLFLCRPWPPEPDRASEKNRERMEINDSRAAYILALRKAFGARCIAGFAPSPFTLEHYPAAVVKELSVTEPRRYVSLMRSMPICIATVGLHQSNGWKLGEYVAASRAIVSEELRHTVPGFAEGKNFLQFRNTVECIEAVGRLMESATRRRAMAEANREYYLSRLRPDRLMTTALALQGPAE